jgi:hypothetical protein
MNPRLTPSPGRLHPGSISEQNNVCGQPAWRCQDPPNPQKHGPYYQWTQSPIIDGRAAWMQAN